MTPPLSNLRVIIQSLGYQVVGETHQPEAIEQAPRGLVLVDCDSLAKDGRGLPEGAVALAATHLVALLQATPEATDEVAALQRGIAGIFYQGLQTDELLKGMRAILAGEYWYNRKVISQVLCNLLEQTPANNSPAPVIDNQEILTTREKSVVALVLRGAKNLEIAEQLNISPHTVKTHLYSAFRKTRSRNRIELINWARQQQHLVLEPETP